MRERKRREKPRGREKRKSRGRESRLGKNPPPLVAVKSGGGEW